jgi:PTS system mannose-specific IIA component
MVGILIIAHGALGETLIQCATHVIGSRPLRVQSLAVSGRGDPETLLALARAAISEVDDGSGVLVLTDMLGGTPSNVAARTVAAGRVEAVAGLNLPMLIRVLTYRNETLEDAAFKAVTGGREGVSELEIQYPGQSSTEMRRRRAAG